MWVAWVGALALAVVNCYHGVDAVAASVTRLPMSRRDDAARQPKCTLAAVSPAAVAASPRSLTFTETLIAGAVSRSAAQLAVSVARPAPLSQREKELQVSDHLPCRACRSNRSRC
jgi:hypothetical protein